MDSIKYIGKPADRNRGVYTLSEINSKIQDQTYPTNYDIENSCRFDGNASYLSKSFASGGSTTTWTLSLWIKRTKLSSESFIFGTGSSSDQANYFYLQTGGADNLVMGNYAGNVKVYPSAKLRDSSSWYHVVVLFDSNTSIFKMYINGVEPSYGGHLPTSSSQSINSNRTHYIGLRESASYYLNAYLSDIYFIDGQALDPTHFAHSHPSTRRWSPKRYQGTYGNNGFHLEFKNKGTNTGEGGIGEDTSGNGNHWAVTGLAAHDIVPDSPSNNFATWNTLVNGGALSDGNLKFSHTAYDITKSTFATISLPNTGVYYWEMYEDVAIPTNDRVSFGICDSIHARKAIQSTYIMFETDSHGYTDRTNAGSPRYVVNGNDITGTNIDYGSGGVISFYVDMDRNTFTIGRNNLGYETYSFPRNYNITYSIFVNLFCDATSGTHTISQRVNFGQDPTFGGNLTTNKTYADAHNRGQFNYPPPATALALCEKNLTQPQDSVSEYLVDNTKTKTLTYTGNVKISKFSPYLQDEYSLYSNNAGLKLTNSKSDFNYLHDNTSDYTISFWMYRMKDTGVSEILIDNAGGTTSKSGFNMIVDGGGTDKLRIYIQKGESTYNAFKFESDYVVPLRQWVHVSFVFWVLNPSGAASTKGKLYINGNLYTSGTYQQDGGYSTSDPQHFLTLGSDDLAQNGFYGYITDFRIVKNRTVTTDPPLSPYSVSETNQDILISASSNIIKDSDTTGTAYTVTPVGSGEVAIEAFSPYTSKNVIPDHSVNGGSFFLDGSNYTKIPIPTGSTDFKLRDSGSFTSRSFMWIYPTSSSGGGSSSNYGNLINRCTSNSGIDWGLGYNTSMQLVFKYWNGSSDNSITNSAAGSSIILNAWNYVGFTIIDNYLKLYVNGIVHNSSGSDVSNMPSHASTFIEVGANTRNSGSYTYYSGYIADLIFDNNNTISTPTEKISTDANTKLLLQPYHTTPAHGVLETLDAYNIEETGKQLIYHKQAKVISSRPFTGIKIGSVAIGGANGDGIEIPSTTDFTFGTGAFTVEMWVRPTNTTSSNGRVTLISHRNANQGGSDTTTWAWFINDNNFEIHDIGAVQVNGGGEFGASGDSLNKWHHVVWCRDSTSMRFYVNGILKKTIVNASYNPNYSTDRQLTIGSDTLVDSTLDGFITDVRIVKGQALYGNTFTPPAHPLSSTHYTLDGTDPTISSTKQTISGSVSLLLQPGKTTSISEVAVKSEKHFKTVIWTGDGSNPRNIPVVFNADFVWIKARNQSYNHTLFDSVRGFGKKHLFSDLTSGESANEYGHVSGVSNNNITVAAGASGDTYVNNSSTTYVGWLWRAGGTPSADDKGVVDGVEQTITGNAKLDAGTLTPTRMSVNTKAGFSIVTYSIPSSTSANDFTIPHGLNKTPEVVIVKNTVQPGHSGSQMWCVYHHSEPTKAGFLNRFIAFSTASLQENFNNSLPTSQVFTVGHPSNNNSGDTCRDGNSYVAYAWHSVPGYSAFGSYVANGSTDGPFIHTGFRPAWVMIKNTNSSSDYSSWMIVDSTRSAFNPSGGGNCLWANNNSSEGYRGNGSAAVGNYDVLDIDFLSNGFKMRGGGHNTETNDAYSSAKVYIYIAFAEQPFTRNRAR